MTSRRDLTLALAPVAFALLALALAVALASAATPASAASCKTAHSGACASNGAACGAPTSHARCETWRQHVWRDVQLRCACRVRTPHGSVVVP